MPYRIIIYEDNPFLRNSFADLIDSSKEFELAGAFENCDDVIEQVKDLSPDVVLMDIEMPGTGGMDGLRIIKKNFAQIQVIMLTVFDDNEKVLEAICAGASGYLLKKTTPEKILDAIQDVMDGGAPMTPSIAKKVLQLFPKTTSEQSEINKLTTQEQKVLQLLESGCSYKMIAVECDVTIETVRTHIKHIYNKLQVHSATEAIKKAFPNRVR